MIEITKENVDSTINKKEGLVVVDFWAPWCGPCKVIGPIISELADEYEGKATIAKINVDDNRDIASQYGIRNIPTLLFIKDGEVVDKQIGASSKSAIKATIDRLVS